MTRKTILHRPTGLTFCLLILSVASGCAHFHDAEVRAQARAGGVHSAAASAAPPLAALRPPASPQPGARTAAVSEPASSAPAPEPAVQAEPVVPPAQPVPAAAGPLPSPSTPFAPATGDAIIVLANIPGAHCVTCETLKISVAPSGQVLIEHGAWGAGHDSWHYKRSRANVGLAHAAAFAASLSADRPAGARLTARADCPAAVTGGDGLSIEWIEAARHDRLTVAPGCTATHPMIARLRHAPDLLGLRQVSLP